MVFNFVDSSLFLIIEASSQEMQMSFSICDVIKHNESEVGNIIIHQVAKDSGNVTIPYSCCPISSNRDLTYIIL